MHRRVQSLRRPRLGPAGEPLWTTPSGGASGWGHRLKVTPEGHETVLYSFHGGADGVFPTQVLVWTGRGNLMGTTSVGGDKGVVLCSAAAPSSSVTPEGRETVLQQLHRSQRDGAEPYAGLVFDWRGNLYGRPSLAGVQVVVPGCGTVFKVTSPKARETVLLLFTGRQRRG